MTTETRRITGQVWGLALPVILTNLLQSLVAVIDVFMVGRLGPIAIAAVGMGTTVRMLVLVLLLSVATGAMSLVAQAKGARDPERMSFVTRQSISSGLLLSVLLGMAGYVLAEPLLRFANSGGDPEAVVLGTGYLQIIFVGTPFVVLNIIFNRLMQGAGDTVTPLLLAGGMNILNVLFSYSLIFGAGPLPALGLDGAAYGTVLARALAVGAALVIIYSGRNVIRLLPGSYRPHWRMYRDILGIGVPSGIQGVFRNGSRLLVTSIVTSTEVGTFGAAALAIGFQVESLAFMPGLGVNVAATSLVGQAVGSWQTGEARRRGNIAIWIGLAIMTLLAVPIVLFAPTLIRLFDPSAHPTLLRAGTSYLRISTVALPLSAIAIVANGALRGAGDTVPGMLSTLVNRTLVTIALAYALAFPLGLGSNGVWLAIAIGSTLDALYMGWRWRGAAWLQVALHKSEIFRRHLQQLPAESRERYLNEVRAPLMAHPTAFEEIHPEYVTYHLPERTIQFQFDDLGFHTRE